MGLRVVERLLGRLGGLRHDDAERLHRQQKRPRRAALLGDAALPDHDARRLAVGGVERGADRDEPADEPHLARLLHLTDELCGPVVGRVVEALIRAQDTEQLIADGGFRGRCEVDRRDLPPRQVLHAHEREPELAVGRAEHGVELLLLAVEEHPEVRRSHLRAAAEAEALDHHEARRVDDRARRLVVALPIVAAEVDLQYGLDDDDRRRLGLHLGRVGVARDSRAGAEERQRQCEGGESGEAGGGTHA